MKAVTVRELHRDIQAILDEVEQGASVEITRGGRPVARLVPTTAPAEPWPDLAARARRVLGRRRISPPPSQQVVADRGER